MSLKKSVGGRGRRAAGAPPVGAAGQAEHGVHGEWNKLGELAEVLGCAAARWNSSRAPFGPRNRSRSRSRRMRLRCANIWPGRASPRRPCAVLLLFCRRSGGQAELRNEQRLLEKYGTSQTGHRTPPWPGPPPKKVLVPTAVIFARRGPSRALRDERLADTT